MSKEKRRVVVTGMGVICSLGTEIKDFWANCLRNHTKVEQIPKHWFDYADFSSTMLSPLPNIHFSEYDISQTETARLDLSTQMAIAATSQALKNAKIEKEVRSVRHHTYILKNIDLVRMGVLFGTGTGGVSTLLSGHAYQAVSNHKKRINEIIKDAVNKDTDQLVADELASINRKMRIANRFNPFIVSMIMPNACSNNISIKYGVMGMSNTLCSACASSTVAIGHAYQAIKTGVLDIAITGGTEYLRDDYGAIFKGFDIIGALACGDKHSVCGPFDKKRNGFLFSEGASAALILEDLEHAQNRGAEILGEIVGFAETCDASSIMAVDKSGAQIKRMIKNVLEEARAMPQDIDYINTHGTGTIVNDEVEAQVIQDVFGRTPLLNSTKSILGHTIGASGAIEAIVALLSIKENKTHICNNLKEPILDLNFVTAVKKHEINTALSQSFAFGGQNAVLAIKGF